MGSRESILEIEDQIRMANVTLNPPVMSSPAIPTRITGEGDQTNPLDVLMQNLPD